MKFLLTQNLIGLDNKDTKQSLGENLGHIMASDNTASDPIKIAGWAKKLFNKEELDLDKSDQKVFEDFVRGTPQLTNLAKLQILEIWDEAKEKAKK